MEGELTVAYLGQFVTAVSGGLLAVWLDLHQALTCLPHL